MGSNRVKRGGSWNNDARNCRVANRNNNSPENTNNNNGFRVALAPQLSGNVGRHRLNRAVSRTGPGLDPVRPMSLSHAIPGEAPGPGTGR